MSSICKKNLIKDQTEGNVFLMTLKIDSKDQKKISLKLRTAEGQIGNLQVFILPQASTKNRTAASLQIPLKPLSLHERISEIKPEIFVDLPLSEIVITGKFSLSEGVQWVSNCLPDVPTSHSESDEGKMSTFFFKSSFLGTYLICQIENGTINVKSDNFSVMTIVKD